MANLELFGEQRMPFKTELAARLADLARQDIFIGTSSWKYEGWLGQIYTPERYFTRGKLSQKKFEAECLNEYAETFPAVCGDFSFYQFPSESYWLRLFAGAPRTLQFAFKVPEMITVRKWPSHARYGDRGGKENDMFLDAGLFERMFLQPLEPYKSQAAVMIFEFGTFNKSQYDSVSPFARDLDAFLAKLPQGWRYSVEIRNREFFDGEYFEVLRAHNAAHVFNSWTRIPGIEQQIANEQAFTADFTVTRALLRPGRSYEDAVKTFSPYDKIQDPNDAARTAIRELLERAKRRKQLTFVFVNNRLEGNAPSTIQAVTEPA
jgi:uncharacterized protein YecE (DUF72 family)